MRVEEWRSEQPGSWNDATVAQLNGAADLVLLFGSRTRLSSPDLLPTIQDRYPNAILTGCSTAGEISDTEVHDDSVSVVAVAFDHTRLRACTEVIDEPKDSRVVGNRVAAALAGQGLSHVFVLSEGLMVNGSELVAGITEALPAHVGVTGGLAGDGALFGNTVVVDDHGVRGGVVRAVGFYGNRLRVGAASHGGWDPFGPERLITKADGNVLYELDHKPALGVYKDYLGAYAAGLPATGLRFPLAIRDRSGGPTLVRTLLAVDEAAGTLTFAGDMPLGGNARLMKANFDRLVDGSVRAAVEARDKLPTHSVSLSILISCVGRKLVLKQRVEEELEGVREVFGDAPVLTGFYSYGEVCPPPLGGAAMLHNQTMTITSFAEV